MLKFKFISLLLIPTLLFADFDHQHSDLNQILQEHVVESSVNYTTLQNNSSKLANYINSLSQISKEEYLSWNSSKQLAFLINAYNSQMLDLVLENLPIKSPKDIDYHGATAWEYPFINLIGQKVSLNQLENQLIRAKFKEPRIHFLVNCAAKSCPPLQNYAITAENLEESLELATKSFLSNKKNNYYDPRSNTLYLSKIFEWYAEDFKKTDSSSLLVFLKKYFPEIDSKTKIKYLKYNWNLNKQ